MPPMLRLCLDQPDRSQLCAIFSSRSDGDGGKEDGGGRSRRGGESSGSEPLPGRAAVPKTLGLGLARRFRVVGERRRARGTPRRDALVQTARGRAAIVRRPPAAATPRPLHVLWRARACDHRTSVACVSAQRCGAHAVRRAIWRIGMLPLASAERRTIQALLLPSARRRPAQVRADARRALEGVALLLGHDHPHDVACGRREHAVRRGRRLCILAVRRPLTGRRPVALGEPLARAARRRVRVPRAALRARQGARVYICVSCGRAEAMLALTLWRCHTPTDMTNVSRGREVVPHIGQRRPRVHSRPARRVAD